MRCSSACKLGLLSLAYACAGPRGLPAGDATAATRQYVIEHRAELELEIQRGSGEALHQLSIIADCQDLPELGRRLRKKQAEIFPVPPASDPQVADRIVVLLREERTLVCRDLETGPERPFVAGRRRVFGPTSSAAGNGAAHPFGG
jgi:hypothetical protein